MPTAPIIIPVIVAGITLGSLLVSEKRKMTKKKVLGISLISGLLNTANAYLVYLLFPPPTFSRFTGGGTFTGGGFGGGGFAGGGSTAFQFRAAAGGGGQTSFLALSFITGFLIVLAIVGIALFYARWKTGRTEEEEEPEEKLDEDEET